MGWQSVTGFTNPICVHALPKPEKRLKRLDMHMISMRSLNSSDLIKIHHWPAYPPEFQELDYALRENGWLAEFHGKPDAWIYVAEQAGEIIAFSLLARDDFHLERGLFERPIALRADKLGQGLGRTITSMTLQQGFSTMNFSRIDLIVRTSNPRAIHLYQQIGFKTCSECEKTVNGKRVNFLAMSIFKPQQ
jgi:RimJ/RimL family protein N-acetyltransferase